MITCHQLTELVTEYLEGALPWREWMRFQMHVGMCADCRRYLDQMRMTLKATGSLSDTPVDEAAHAALLERFKDWHSDSEAG